MTGLEELVVDAMGQLATQRPIFHSEADFQLALAWEIRTAHPEAEVRLERRVLNDPRVELDILVTLEDERYGLELKYPRSNLDVEVAGERFALRTGAPDLDRYDVLRDIARLERLVNEEVIDEGCGLALTNAPGLWQPAPRATPASYDAFRIHDGHVVSGTLDWGPTAGEGTRSGRAGAIPLTGRYSLSWRDYSAVGGRQFRYLAVPVAGDAPTREDHDD